MPDEDLAGKAGGMVLVKLYADPMGCSTKAA